MAYMRLVTQWFATEMKLSVSILIKFKFLFSKCELSHLIPLNKTGEIIQEVKAGRIDAAIIEDTIARGFVANNPDLVFNTIPNTESAGSAIAFSKGSELVDDFNRVLKQMKESGEIERLVKKWFENNGKTEATSTTSTGTTETTSTANFSFAKIVPSIPYILEGIFVTLKFTAISAVFGFI